jgi:hypothetical protein
MNKQASELIDHQLKSYSVSTKDFHREKAKVDFGEDELSYS